ncbi:MAG: hypothetical protein BJ554DRAFT_6149 [Olpidium bornovanus]|uniref:Polyprotein n=1 Tax=Olpidium bornovanus TaxID=278681 RepID=A0A8H7ZYP3_9FUNG|nr:MAG: hypothetical protein BJ554DRAFT_6149 [Olpidium bornovanus]
MATPTDRHWGTVKGMLRYIRGTMEDGIQFEPQDANRELAVYCVADWAGCHQTRASTLGMVILYNGSPISWWSARQKCIATSSFETEFVSGLMAAQEVRLIRSILMEIDETAIKEVTKMYIDNNGAMELAKNDKTSKKSKHIDIRYHHLRQCVTDKEIAVERVASVENPADMFTKPLDKVKFAKFKEMVGVNAV